MISKYMQTILDKLLNADFRFLSYNEGAEEFDMKKLPKEVQSYIKLMDKGGEEAERACLTTIVKANFYKPDTDIVLGSDLYQCPDSENVMRAKLFETKEVHDAYGTHDIEIEGKTVRLLNNYGDEDGNSDRVGDNYAWFSPCIMFEQGGKLVFELVDLVVPKEEFGQHKPCVYRHAKVKTNIPAKYAKDVGFGKRAFFYGKNWLLNDDTQDNVFSIRHFLEPKTMEKLGLAVTDKTQHIKFGEFNLCVSDGMLIIPASEVAVNGHNES